MLQSKSANLPAAQPGAKQRQVPPSRTPETIEEGNGGFVRLQGRSPIVLRLLRLDLAEMITPRLSDGLSEGMEGLQRGVVTPGGHVLVKHCYLVPELAEDVREWNVNGGLDLLANAHQQVPVDPGGPSCLAEELSGLLNFSLAVGSMFRTLLCGFLLRGSLGGFGGYGSLLSELQVPLQLFNAGRPVRELLLKVRPLGQPLPLKCPRQ